MSTVDKKLMGQMLRFAKTVVITSANAKEGTSVSDCERPGKRDAQYLRAIMERGLRTLPLEQRVLSEAAFDKRAFDLGKVFVIRQLGIWEMMSYETLRGVSEYVAFPELLDGRENKGLENALLTLSMGKTTTWLCLPKQASRCSPSKKRPWKSAPKNCLVILLKARKCSSMCCCARSRELLHMNRNLLPMCANEQELHKCQSKAAILLL